MQLRIKTPAKINLTLDVLGVRDDGYHDIASVMQTISLYDYLSFKLSHADALEINLSGSNPNIPYDERNLVYKAILLFYKEVENIPLCRVEVYIEKNIPTEAGMGGGSSNAAGTIWALNRLLKTNLSEDKINSLCAKLGSDLNACYWGGASLATSRGEKIRKLPFYDSKVSIIKPLGFGISAKQGYQWFDELALKPVDSTEKMVNAICEGKCIKDYLHNDLEIAPLKRFAVLQRIKETFSDSIMTGSGSTFFVLQECLDKILPSEEYLTIQGLKFVNNGIEEV